MKTYKIVEVKDDAIYALFHGVEGSRVLKPGEWLEAKLSEGRDGSGERWYQTGFHSLPTIESAREYLARFKSRTERLRIAECEALGTWEKEHSPSPVVLSRYLKINRVLEIRA